VEGELADKNLNGDKSKAVANAVSSSASGPITREIIAHNNADKTTEGSKQGFVPSSSGRYLLPRTCSGPGSTIILTGAPSNLPEQNAALEASGQLDQSPPPHAQCAASTPLVRMQRSRELWDEKAAAGMAAAVGPFKPGFAHAISSPMEPVMESGEWARATLGSIHQSSIAPASTAPASSTSVAPTLAGSAAADPGSVIFSVRAHHANAPPSTTHIDGYPAAAGIMAAQQAAVTMASIGQSSTKLGTLSSASLLRTASNVSACSATPKATTNIIKDPAAVQSVAAFHAALECAVGASDKGSRRNSVSSALLHPDLVQFMLMKHSSVQGATGTLPHQDLSGQHSPNDVPASCYNLQRSLTHGGWVDKAATVGARMAASHAHSEQLPRVIELSKPGQMPDLGDALKRLTADRAAALKQPLAGLAAAGGSQAGAAVLRPAELRNSATVTALHSAIAALGALSEHGDLGEVSARLLQQCGGGSALRPRDQPSSSIKLLQSLVSGHVPASPQVSAQRLQQLAEAAAASAASTGKLPVPATSLYAASSLYGTSAPLPTLQHTSHRRGGAGEPGWPSVSPASSFLHQGLSDAAPSLLAETEAADGQSGQQPLLALPIEE